MLGFFERRACLARSGIATTYAPTVSQTPTQHATPGLTSNDIGTIVGVLGVSLAFVTLVVAILQLRQGKRRRDHERRGNEANINAASRNDAEGPDTSLAGPVDDLGHAMNALPPTRPIRNVDQSADMAAGSNFDASLTGKTFASSTTPIAERTDQDLTMVTPAV